MSYWTAERV